MEENSPSLSVLGFGVFELDLRTGELRKSGALVKLPPQPFKVLTILAGRSGEIVSREELRQQIWGEGTFVDFEQGLNYCIKQIRLALATMLRHRATLKRSLGAATDSSCLSKNEIPPARAPAYPSQPSSLQSDCCVRLSPSRHTLSCEAGLD